MSLVDTLQKVAKARAAHTEAETDIFTNYVNGVPLAGSVKAVQDLIKADTDLAAALTELLQELAK